MKSIDKLESLSSLDLLPNVYSGFLESEALASSCDFIKALYTNTLKRIFQNSYLQTANVEILNEWESALHIDVLDGATLDERREAISLMLANSIHYNEAYIMGLLLNYLNGNNIGYDDFGFDIDNQKFIMMIGGYDNIEFEGRSPTENVGRLLAPIMPMNIELDLRLAFYDETAFYTGIAPVVSIDCEITTEDIPIGSVIWWQSFLDANKSLVGASVTGFVCDDGIDSSIILSETIGLNTSYPITSYGRYSYIEALSIDRGCEGSWEVGTIDFWNLNIALTYIGSPSTGQVKSAINASLITFFNLRRAEMFSGFLTDIVNPSRSTSVSITAIITYLMSTSINVVVSNISITKTGATTMTYLSNNLVFPAIGSVTF